MSHHSEFLSVVSDWIASQRWFGNKVGQPQLASIGSWKLPTKEAGTRLYTHLFMDHGSVEPTLYQVPISERRKALADSSALIGTIRGEDGRTRHLYDAPHDPAYASALLRMIVGASTTPGVRSRMEGVAFEAVDPEAFAVLSSSVLSGEQSNTSIIYRVKGLASTDRVICKVFRALHHGENPDVVLQSALAAGGSTHVPRSIGALVGEWPDVGRVTGTAHGHVAFAQEFIPGAEDGWRYALRIAGAGDSFAEQARTLGLATAEVHATLTQVQPTREPSDEDIEATIAAWLRRLDVALAEVPAVAEFEPLIRGLYAAARTFTWPRMQRIHGDFHLGQVLVVPDGRWVLLDFEGEPMRPMVERSRPDFAIRDVAGMLRSVDYVTGSLGGGEDVQEWAAEARHAFLDGYIEGIGDDLRAHRLLLDAFEVDKAVYEAVYETRNRPNWLPIPTAAIRRLAGRAQQTLASG